VRWFRGVEIALFVIGFSLLGGATAAVVRSQAYQARQGRAFSGLERREVASSRPAESPSIPEDPPASRTAVASPDADPLVLGRIEIPRIGISAIVREGVDDATLSVAVGHVPGTALPGELGNMALAGHRDSFFRALRHIRVDDTIRFRSPESRYDYRVGSTEVVGPNDTRVLHATGGPVLTLVTCYPFGYVGPAPDRFVVRAYRLAP